MGLPGLRGPPGTKVNHKFTTSYTQLCVSAVYMLILSSLCVFSGFAWLQRREG